MATVKESIDVAVDVTTAYNQWTQFESFPQFMSGVESIVQVDDRTNHWVTKIGGVEREFDTQIIEQVPDTRIVWRSVDGKAHEGTVTFEDLTATSIGTPKVEPGEPQTRVTVRFAWDDETFVEKAGATLGLDSLQVKRDLGMFKKFIESRGTETGAWRGRIDESGGPV